MAQADEKPAKKAKKEKSKKPAASAEEVAGACQALASVGDATLAQNGKKIVKALYKEHPEVKAMSAQQVWIWWSPNGGCSICIGFKHR